MHVIAKMKCASIEDYGLNRKIKLACVYDGAVNSSTEDRSFTKATPNGEAFMTVDNQAVWPAFRPAQWVEKDGSRYVDYDSASTHYVLFVDAKEYTLADVHRALASLDKADA